MTSQQHSVLDYLATREHPSPLWLVSRHTGVDRIGRVVAELERRGLVQVTRYPEADRMAATVVLCGEKQCTTH